MGAIPGLPKVHLHNPVLAYEVGDDFMKYFYQAERGELDPFVLVVEGSIPNEHIKGEGYWAALGTDPETGQPITTRVDRPPRAESAGRDRRRNLRHLRRHSRHGRQSHRMHGTGRLSRLELALEGRHCRSSMCPAARCSPTTSWRRCSTCCYQVAGLAPMIPLDEQLRPTWLFGKTVHEGCDRAGYYEQDDFALEYGSPKCLVKVGCWGPVVNCNVTKRGWMRGIGGCPNVGGICIGCTMPGFPDKFMPFMDEPSGARFSTAALDAVRQDDPRAARHHQQHREQRAQVAAARSRAHHWLSTQTRRVHIARRRKAA